MYADDYTHDDTYTRYNVELALKTGDLAYAREILRPVLQGSPSADVWYLAALVASSRDEQIERLERALALNPDHTRAAAALEQARLAPVLPQPPVRSLLARLTQAFRPKKS